MKIYTVPDGQLDMNGYIVTTNDKDAIIIDCGGSLVLQEAEKQNLNVTHMLLTHGHFDHMVGCNALKEKGVKIGILEREAQEALSHHNELEFCMDMKDRQEVEKFMKHGKFDFTFQDGDKLQLAGMDILVLSTPGHTIGGCCYLIENHLFTGDTLFYECVGRTDLATGNMTDLQNSIDKLLQLDNEIVVHPGHGWSTTIGHEKAKNPLSKYR